VKIIQVTPRYYPDIGGVETDVKEISERLVKRGFEVEVVCTDPTGQLRKNETINGVAITRFRSFAPGDAYYFAPQIYFYLKAHIYDIIHAHNYHALPALFAMLAKNGRRLIFTPYYHGGGHTPIRNLLLKPYRSVGSKILEKSDKVTCVSEYERRKVISDFGVSPAKIEIIPVGLNLEEFANLKHNKRHNVEKTLLYVGRLEEYKGVQNIIKTLPHLPGFKLEVIGKGPYETDLHTLAEKLSVIKRINWHKNITREELLQQYASADVFLMLSTHESYGITVAEALASGVPCIVAMGSALEEFVDGETCTGLSYPIDTHNLASTIESMSHKRAIVVKNIIDWNEVVKRLIKIYEEKSCQ
jgi:glycosyltransferase involved in cell wall biosynthesis